MSEESVDDREDLAALDSLFHKYGAASSAARQKEDRSRGSFEIPVDLQQQIPSKSFLQEIQERAQILSVQRERSAKKTLQTIVSTPTSQRSDNLDDFVKLIRSAPITDDSHQQTYIETLTPTLDRSPPGFEPGTSDHLNKRLQPGCEPGTSDNWSKHTYYAKHVYLDLDLDPNQESKDYSGSESESDSEYTVTEEVTDTESNASDLNFTWELNTDLEGESIQAESSGYFELDSLDDTDPSEGRDRYFHLSALDDTLNMADTEPPNPVPEDNVHDDEEDHQDGIVALSDDEPVGDDVDGDENVMEVDDSKKSFKTTLGDEKVLDGIIDDMSENQHTATEEDDVVSGDETTNTKAPSDDDDWVLLPKSSDENPMEVGNKERDDDEDQGEEQDNVQETTHDIEEEQDNVQDIQDKVQDNLRDMEDEHKDKKRKIEQETQDASEMKDDVMDSLKDEEDSSSSEEDVDSSRVPPPDTHEADDSSEIPPSDTKEEDKDEDEAEEDTVVMRNKPQGSLHPQQRHSLPEFDIFDSAKRLDTEMLKSRARLGKQGALAQRRKPTKPGNQDPSRRQTWMFGDPNDTKNLLNLEGIEEEAEKTHNRAPRHSEPVNIGSQRDTSPSPKPRKPIGGIGGPMLLAGLGGPVMLKKTSKQSPLEDKPSTLPTSHEDQTAKTEAPRLIKPKPARPTPASRPKPSQTPLKPSQPPSWLTKPKPKPRPGAEKPNHEILNAQREADVKAEEPKVPAWMADAKMRLPPISPRTSESKDTESSNKDTDSTNKESNPPDMDTSLPNKDSSSTSRAGKKPVAVPLWKQNLIKMKKEEDTTGKKRHSMPPPVAKKPDASSGSSPFTTMPQWQVDLAEKKNQRKIKEDAIGKQESPKVPAWKREAAERTARIQKQQEERAKVKKEREIKDKEKKEQEDKVKAEKKEESAPLSPMQTAPSVTPIIKDLSEGEEKQDQPKSPSWKVENSGPRKDDGLEKTKKDKDTENKAPPKLPISKKPVLSPKPKPTPVQMRTPKYGDDDIPQWKKELVKKRRVSDWRSRLRSASIDHDPTSPTSKNNEESNKFNEDQNSTMDKETKRHTICTITDLPVKIPRNPSPGNVPQWKIELERKNRKLAEHMATIDSVPDN